MAQQERWRFGVAAAAVVSLVALSGCLRPKTSAPPPVATPASHLGADARALNLEPSELNKWDAVVRFNVNNVTCSGTLIAEDLVLTAHHCVAARNKKGQILHHDVDSGSIADFVVEVGSDPLPYGKTFVRAIVSPDCGYTTTDGDIAILVLERKLTGVPTMAPRMKPPRAAKDGRGGEKLSVRGWGQCSANGSSIALNFRSFGSVERVDPGLFTAQASICPGDSGGPVYDDHDELVGVVSASVMDHDDQTRGESYFTRVDEWPQLFSAARAIADGASPSELPPFRTCR